VNKKRDQRLLKIVVTFESVVPDVGKRP